MRLFDDQGRQELYDVVAGWHCQQSVIERLRDQFTVRHAALHAPHHAYAAHAFDNGRIPRHKAFEFSLHEFSHLDDMIEKPFFKYHVENRIGAGCRQRVAAERAAMGAGYDTLRRFRRREASADRKTAA